MFGKGVFELGSSQALTIPQQAVVIRDGFSYAFRVNPDLRVTQLKVQTGRRQGTQVEVLEGIKPEDDLVVQGAGFLNDGDLVKVAPTLAPTASSAPAAPAKK
jgi:multidrug efflux pump subunit AcrA (membrane-fusion protein)